MLDVASEKLDKLKEDAEKIRAKDLLKLFNSKSSEPYLTLSDISLIVLHLVLLSHTTKTSNN